MYTVLLRRKRAIHLSREHSHCIGGGVQLAGSVSLFAYGLGLGLVVLSIVALIFILTCLPLITLGDP